MTILTEYFNWWVVDELTGTRYLTPFKLSRSNAERAFPGARPSLKSQEIRTSPDPVAIGVDQRATDADLVSAPVGERARVNSRPAVRVER